MKLKREERIMEPEFSTGFNASYTLTDSFLVNIGGSYFDSGTVARSTDGASVEESATEPHLGAGYLLKLSEKIRFISLAGLSVQRWSYQATVDPQAMDQQTIDQPSGLGFDRFEATIISPFVQGGFIFGGARTNLNLAFRLERASFQFENAEPKEATTDQGTVVHTQEEQVLLMIPVLQGNLAIFDDWALYAQFLLRGGFGLSDRAGFILSDVMGTLDVSYIWDSTD